MKRLNLIQGPTAKNLLLNLKKKKSIPLDVVSGPRLVFWKDTMGEKKRKEKIHEILCIDIN